ncbi:MerR family transcriptional regulator [Sphingobacterium sp. 18053]|uniref:MerR family transcriptional regulator n=1 Tax=Sphingobacterium sp. 18053 TaxID=2681401 RepID=UPI00135917DF|nr:MerR family transcriptional regulator [Sphingobacterium sp. 18053]
MRKNQYLKGFSISPGHSFTQKLILLELLALKRQLATYLELREQLEAENVLLRDAEYVKSHVGISTETLYRLQRDGYICIAKRERNKRFYRDVDVERLRKSYRGL